MTTFQRKKLGEIMVICDSLGGHLDGTATNTLKYIDRQRALATVAKAIYGVLGDDKRNDYREEDKLDAVHQILKLQALKEKIYPDRNGFFE